MKPHLLDLRNILLIVGITFLATWYAILLTYMLTGYKGLKGGADYLAHYSAGYILRYVSPERLYDLDLQRQIQEAVAPPDRLERYYYYNHPPFLAGILGWVTTKDYNSSYFRWVLFLIVFHLTSLGLLVYLMRRFQWQVEEIWVLGISGLLFAPLFVAYLKGQDSTFLLLGVSLWTFGLLTARDRVAGLGLALGALALTQLPLLIYNFTLLNSDPTWSQFTRQNQTLSPPPVYYLWGFGLLWLFALIGTISAFRQRKEALLASAAWVVVGFLATQPNGSANATPGPRLPAC